MCWALIGFRFGFGFCEVSEFVGGGSEVEMGNGKWETAGCGFGSILMLPSHFAGWRFSDVGVEILVGSFQSFVVSY